MSAAGARECYTERRDRFRRELARRDAQGARLANLRVVTFLGALALLLAVIFERVPRWGLLGTAACLLAYAGLAAVHAGVIRAEERARALVALNEKGLARLDGGWHRFPATGAGLLPDGHLYAADLDVVGQGSLFQRLDETGTKGGEERLAGWLGAPPASLDETRARQQAVQELAPLIDFRQALVTEARRAGTSKADPSGFIAWAEGDGGLARLRWAFPLAHALPPLTLAAGGANLLGLLGPLPFWAGVAVQVLVVLLTRAPLTRLYEALARSDRGFLFFEDTFAAIDAQPLEHPLLRGLQAGLQPAGPRVSERLQRFERLLGLAELRQSGLMHPVINALFLWDVHVLFRLEAWRRADGRGVRAWFDALAQLEALSSFAGYAFESPTHAWPELLDGPLCVEAQALGHPLLEDPVCNDVALSGPGRALVVTGSNMSGKTTLMRALGLDVVMALAGLPVRAAAMRVSKVQVMTSMRLKDSLERGVSYFYAEVQRIKALLDTARAHPGACLFLLDELFMGTNTRERQLASRHLLTLLLDAGASGAVTTHDLSLTELAQEREGVRNVHFRDLVEHGEMTFDYRLRDGVVTTTNALEVLRRAGIALPDAPQ